MSFFKSEADYRSFIERCIIDARRHIEFSRDFINRFSSADHASAEANIKYQQGMIDKCQGIYKERYGRRYAPEVKIVKGGKVKGGTA